MARVEIENRIWGDPRFRTFRSMTGFSPAFGVGILSLLWHSSQDEMKENCTDREISHWFVDEKIDTKTLIGSLCESGFLVPMDKNTFRIVGNKDRIKRVKSWRENGVIGAKNRWKGKKKGRKNDAALGQEENANPIGVAIATPSTFDANPIGVSMRTPLANMHIVLDANRLIESEVAKATQTTKVAMAPVENLHTPDPVSFVEARKQKEGAAVTVKAEVVEEVPAKAVKTRQTKTPVDATGSTNTAETKGAHRVIAAYCRAYKTKFGVSPEIMGPEAGAARTLVRDLGEEKACQYVAGYLEINDAWFIRNNYRLAVLVQNVNKVKTSLETGLVMNDTVARQAEFTSTNVMAAREFMKRRSSKASEGSSYGDTAEIAAPW